MRQSLAVAACAAAAVLAVPAAGQSNGADVAVRIGMERVSGDYGGVTDVQDLYVPVTLLVERGRFGLRATLPYLEIEFIDPATGRTYTETGLGDAVLGVTWFDALVSRRGRWLVDATLKAKLGTGEETRGLGTGEVDYTLLADVRRVLERGALIATAGYRSRGEPAGVILDDGWIASLGVLRRFGETVTGSVFLDYRDSATPGLEAAREASASLSWRLREAWRVQAYVVRGLTDATIEWGTGLSVRRDF